MNKTPIIAYLAFSFTGSFHGVGNPKVNTERARQMALAIMKVHPEWNIIVPHYAIDAMLDGTNKWDKVETFKESRRKKGGIMSLAFLSKADILILGCEPTYQVSHGVTWEYIFANLLNDSWRKDNSIKIVYAETIIGKEKYERIMGIGT